MFSENHIGPTPRLWACGDSDHEAQIVVDELIKYQSEGRFLGEVALLYRSNTQVPPFEDQLRLSQIPYAIIGGQKFYEKKEIKDLIAYLSVCHNSKDELSLRRILNIPHRGIGNKSLQDFLDLAKERDITLFEAIKIESNKEGKRAEALREFISHIHRFRENFLTMNIHQALASIIQDIEYMPFVEKSYDSPKIVARKKDDVRNFLFSAEKFLDRFQDEATLSFWLERLLLADNQDNQKDSDEIMRNEVQLMTLHSSKGLEFDTVFMLGCEEELLPHKNVIKENGDIDEERRLFYVGVTRAKKKLIMTHAQKRKVYGKELERHKTRFLLDIDETTYIEQDRTSFGHFDTEEEVEEYKSNFFNDLLSSLDD
jgi:superfamily I DNA/RNA helicase